MPRTSFGKTRPQEKPYAIYKNTSGWEWRVLKTYKHSDAERKEPSLTTSRPTLAQPKPSTLVPSC